MLLRNKAEGRRQKAEGRREEDFTKVFSFHRGRRAASGADLKKHIRKWRNGEQGDKCKLCVLA
ncbi:MAG: hypothetical protein F6K41_14525 [Symploca sp. SIO3E6]|nr:hypothetical protein [Caldora sp. SIO3E6]